MAALAATASAAMMLGGGAPVPVGRRRHALVPSCLPIILAALLAAAVQPAGDPVGYGGPYAQESDRGLFQAAIGQVGLCISSNRVQPCACPAPQRAAAAQPGAELDPGAVPGLPELGEGGVGRNECSINGIPAASDPEEAPVEDTTASLWRADVIALMVRGGLIFLEFGSRPLKNAKRIFSCGLICFALYRYQFPTPTGVQHHSPKKILVQKIMERRLRSLPPQKLHAELVREAGLSPFCPVPLDAWESAGWLHGGLCLPSQEQLDGAGPAADAARETSTWRFASFFLVIKLVSKMLVLLNLKKTSKKLRVVKIFKLAKLAKLAKFSLGPKSFKLIIRLLRMLKLFKLLKLSRRSKRLYSKKHYQLCKPLFKSFKILKLLVAATLL
mmetsp:Transcript_42920/g.104976  ORF Transcript_42920/g.104976 Transcript_42920/m.104976 type:complete len:386 (+) Transcript_42920:134-1291(+)